MNDSNHSLTHVADCTLPKFYATCRTCTLPIFSCHMSILFCLNQDFQKKTFEIYLRVFPFVACGRYIWHMSLIALYQNFILHVVLALCQYFLGSCLFYFV